MRWKYLWALTKAEKDAPSWLLVGGLESVHPYTEKKTFIKHLFCNQFETEAVAKAAQASLQEHPEKIDALMEENPLSLRRDGICKDSGTQDDLYFYGPRMVRVSVVCGGRRADRFFPFSESDVDPWTCPSSSNLWVVRSTCWGWKEVQTVRDGWMTPIWRKGPVFLRAFDTEESAREWVTWLIGHWPTRDSLREAFHQGNDSTIPGRWYTIRGLGPNGFPVSIQYGTSARHAVIQHPSDYYTVSINSVSCINLL